jgi:hypothetical protein
VCDSHRLIFLAPLPAPRLTAWTTLWSSFRTVAAHVTVTAATEAEEWSAGFSAYGGSMLAVIPRINFIPL